MKKNTFKIIVLFIIILFTSGVFANNPPNYPKGFSPKTNSSISFTQNKGQIHDQNYKSRPDVLFGGSDGNLVFHLKNNGISYQLNTLDHDDLTTSIAILNYLKISISVFEKINKSINTKLVL